MAAHYVLTVPSGGQHIIRCRLSACDDRIPLSVTEKGFDEMVTRRKNEADEFYKTVLPGYKLFCFFFFCNFVFSKFSKKNNGSQTTVI